MGLYIVKKEACLTVNRMQLIEYTGVELIYIKRKFIVRAQLNLK